MAPVRAKLIGGLLLVALLAGATTPGIAFARAGRAAAPANSPRCTRRALEQPPRHGPTVSAALSALLAKGAIERTAYSEDLATYVAAKHAIGNLSGTRRSELEAVLANTQALAASGQLIPSRLPIAFLTLERNRQWWTTEPLLGSLAAGLLPGQRDRVGALRRARVSRSSGWGPSARATATSPRTKTRTSASCSRK